MKIVKGGVTAARGFVAGSISCGIKSGGKLRPDLAMIYSTAPAVAAGTFTTNSVKAAPVLVSKAHLKARIARGIVANSGNANACTGAVGTGDARRMAAAAAQSLGVRENEMFVCSTGRIGVPMPIEKIERSIAQLSPLLSANGSTKAARAIMTSDSFAKETAVEFALGGKRVRLGGIAKGAGMIDPNMATMLCFLTTDAAVAKSDLQRALAVAVEQSFNRITVDGDMSTNDTVILLANGMAGNAPVKGSDVAFGVFQKALNEVTLRLARMIVEDGEGVTKFIELRVRGAASVRDARRAAEAIANSALVKCAWFGSDPNWGRIMDALGYSKAKISEPMIDIFYDKHPAVRGGVASRTPVAALRKICRQQRFTITVDLRLGSAEYTVFTTDLTPRYVQFNKGE
ncbi:MAG: bifunctional glutamate N-acetyltransferase/amino-acid acetyltransferase ArgJ [Verrucomicrobiota bacterium]|nr:bifunctional glutamate N-acetyltransferase/amino-acid acetyltransferase ArgJ [Verrucomicrobiota bacterium]